jgi:EpsI family protein
MTSTTRYFLATIVLLGGTLLFATLSDNRRAGSLAKPLASIPRQIGDWTGVDSPPINDSVLQILRPTSYLDRVYRRGTESLSLFISYYSEQRAGENMHSPKNCLPGSGWEIWKYGSAAVPLPSGDVRINQYSVQNSGNRMVVLYWYQSQRRIVASEYLGKVLLVRDALLRGSTEGSIVRINVADRPGSVEDGIAFAARIIPEVQKCFGL